MVLLKSKFMKDSFNLYKYQQAAIVLGLKQKKGLLPFRVGRGKTLTSLAMFSYLLEHGRCNKCIFVSKPIVAEGVPAVVSKNFNEMRCLSSVGKTKKDRKRVYDLFEESQDYQVLSISYGVLTSDFVEIRQLLLSNRVFLILDEATMFKNQSSKVYKNVSSFCQSCEYILSMSGTAVMNRLQDLYFIFRAMGIILFKYTDFYKRFCVYSDIWTKGFDPYSRTYKPMRRSVISGYKNINEFHRVSDPYIFNVEMDDSDLPTFVLNKVYFDVDSVIKDVSKWSSDANGVFSVARSMISNVNPNHIYSSLGMSEVAKGLTQKVDFVINDLLTDIFESDEQVLIYTPYESLIGYLVSCFKDVHGDIGYSVISGQVKNRQVELSNFVSGKSRVMFLTDAAGMGTDGLQCANHLIFLHLPNSGGQFQQICGRISRVGSGHDRCFIHLPMYKKNIDEYQYLVIQKQLRLIDKLVSGSVDVSLFDDEVDLSGISDDVDSWLKSKLTGV